MCCGNNGFGGSGCLWIILLIIILCCCGNGTAGAATTAAATTAAAAVTTAAAAEVHPWRRAGRKPRFFPCGPASAGEPVHFRQQQVHPLVVGLPGHLRLEDTLPAQAHGKSREPGQPAVVVPPAKPQAVPLPVVTHGGNRASWISSRASRGALSGGSQMPKETCTMGTSG